MAAFLLSKPRAIGRLGIVFSESPYGRNGLPTWVKDGS